MNNRTQRFGHRAALGLLAVVGVTFTLMYLLTPFYGDDWGYLGIHRTSTGLDGHYPLWQFWIADLRHWLHSNGRMANFLATFFLGAFPKWLIDIMLGLAAVAGAALIARLGGIWRRNGYGSMTVLIVAIYAMLFPWWDMMFTIDFAFNYPFSLAVVLAAVYWLGQLKDTAVNTTLTILVVAGGFIAGCMHESATLPLALGFALWIWHGKRWQDYSVMQRRLIYAFVAGTLVATFSPGIILRAVADEIRIPDDPAWLLVIKSAPITLLIFIAFALSLIFSRNARRQLPRLLDTRALAWGTAAIIALGPLAVGGIVGRSGWFSQAYALIFLCYWVRDYKIQAPRWLAVTAASIAWIVTAAQSIATTCTAVEFNRRMTEIDEALIASPDCIIFAEDIDYTTRPWWTLQRIVHRTQDMNYDRTGFATFHHKSSLPVILPPEAENLDFTTLDSVTLPGDKIITVTRPAEIGPTITVVPFDRAGRHFYFIFPSRRLAWGERYFAPSPEETE